MTRTGTPAIASPSYAPSGWFESAGNVVAIGALGLAYAAGHSVGAHPVAFILYAMIASSTAMLAVTGFGPDAWAIARHRLSWIVGGSIILIEVFYYLTISYVPPAHGNLILRIGVPIAMATGWLLFGRRSQGLAVAGALAIVAATAFVAAVTPPDVRWPMAVSGVLAATFMVVRGFAGEFHPWNRAARTVREKLRVTGVLVLVTSILSLAGAALAATGIAIGLIPPVRFVPTGAQMLHVPTILLGSIAGGGILTLMAYLSFSAVVKITTENNMAMMAFSPVTTWAFQELGVALGLIAVARPEPRLIAAMAVIITAVLMIFWAGKQARGN